MSAAEGSHDTASRRIYTFGAIAFCTKYFPISGVSYNGLSLTMDAQSLTLIIGMFATLTGLLTIAGFTGILISGVQSKVRSHQEAESEGVAAHKEAVRGNAGKTDNIGNLSYVYLPLYATAKTIEIGTPIIFGAVVLALCLSDSWDFLNFLVNVL